MALVPCQVLRVAILLSYCSILCNYKAIEMPSHQTYGGSWKFLTFIDLVIQAVFFGICVLTDLSSLLTRGSGNQEQERQLKKLISLRDWMLAVLAFPVGVFVVAVFWIIYAYDREMIYPKLLDNFIPGWLNHGMRLRIDSQLHDCPHLLHLHVTSWTRFGSNYWAWRISPQRSSKAIVCPKKSLQAFGTVLAVELSALSGSSHPKVFVYECKNFSFFSV
ncbi:androgen-induced gene 1 protein isoform X3 [Elephas maximus indicus]|uniref:androgen-induced gene 1 protein isoform X3 n=1 Tax=Elephas maximus indicus TaxID=99487 RepID=UPI0021162A69|nr:androgen-induced gene 1 protein isoform X3 [Elephas maximus indicus]